MYKDKRIKFKQINEQEIEVYLEYEDFKSDNEAGFITKEKLIGNIKSPSDQGSETSIQICGISKAHTYWGCGNFGKPKIRKENSSFREYYYNAKGNKIMEQVRDIQLEFDEDTQRCSLDTLDDCNLCFNTDCTCDNKGDEVWNTGSPYNLEEKKTENVSLENIQTGDKKND